LKILANNYKIRSIKKLGINYQIEFYEKVILDDIKKFLILDTKVNFSYIDSTRLRSSTKNFANEQNLLEYLLFIFNYKQEKKRIVIKKK